MKKLSPFGLVLLVGLFLPRANSWAESHFSKNDSERPEAPAREKPLPGLTEQAQDLLSGKLSLEDVKPSEALRVVDELNQQSEEAKISNNPEQAAALERAQVFVQRASQVFSSSDFQKRFADETAELQRNLNQ